MDQQAAPADVEREVKKGQALDLRIGGANYREIGRALKISPSTAHEYVTEGLLQVVEDNNERVEVLRKLEKARLEAVLVKLWTKRDNPRVADTITRISARISALEGLDLGRASADEPPPPPPSSSLPARIEITLVAPDGTKSSGSGTIPPAAETKAPGAETT